MRIVLDYDNEEHINKIVLETGRSASSVVNEVLRKIEIKLPSKKKVELDIDEFDINKVGKKKKEN